MVTNSDAQVAALQPSFWGGVSGRIWAGNGWKQAQESSPPPLARAWWGRSLLDRNLSTATKGEVVFLQRCCAAGGGAAGARRGSGGTAPGAPVTRT